MTMNVKRWAAVILAAAVLAMPAAPAVAVPTAGLTFPWTGLEYSNYGTSLWFAPAVVYDAPAGRLRAFSEQEGAYIRFTPPSLGNCYPGDTSGCVLGGFTTRLTLDVGVDKWGEITDAGLMEWYGDFGAGFELLAAGTVRDLGFATVSVNPEDGGYASYLNMALLLDTSYLDARVYDLGATLVLTLEYFFSSSNDPNLAGKTPFYDDFVCSGDWRTSLRCGGPVSTSALLGVKVVSEPESLFLLAIGLVALGIASRHKLNGGISQSAAMPWRSC